jgi:hypothetical protein
VCRVWVIVERRVSWMVGIGSHSIGGVDVAFEAGGASSILLQLVQAVRPLVLWSRHGFPIGSSEDSRGSSWTKKEHNDEENEEESGLVLDEVELLPPRLREAATDASYCGEARAASSTAQMTWLSTIQPMDHAPYQKG